MGIDVLLGLIGTLGGMVLPPIVDFVKKKFLPAESDTPERTISTLATTQPAAVAGYVDSLAKYLQSQVAFFNRDVVGKPSQWVVDLRACIRPLTVCFSFGMLGLEGGAIITLDAGTRAGFLTVIGNWIGSRIFQH